MPIFIYIWNGYCMLWAPLNTTMSWHHARIQIRVGITSILLFSILCSHFSPIFRFFFSEFVFLVALSLQIVSNAYFFLDPTRYWRCWMWWDVHFTSDLLSIFEIESNNQPANVPIPYTGTHLLRQSKAEQKWKV